MENEKRNKSEYGMILPFIPYEILVHILLRVPASSLTRFKSVSKSWHALFSSQDFIRAHLEISRSDKKLIKYGYTPGHSCRNFPLFSLESLLNDIHITPSSSKLDDSYLGIEYNAWMVASCDGLICLFTKPNHIWIWNPATRRCRKLPMLIPRRPGCLVFIGFGYYEPTNDYKVVAIHCPYDDVVVDDNLFDYDSDNDIIDDDFLDYDDYRAFQVYSLNTHTWETVVKYCRPTYQTPAPNCVSGLFFNNKPYWLEHYPSARGLRYFDLATCKFGAIEDPYGIAGENTGGILKELDGQLCLCIIRKTTLDFWLIKEKENENGKEYTWTKFFSYNKFVTINSSLRVGVADVLHISKKGNILSLVMNKYGKRWLMVYDSKVCLHRVFVIPTNLMKAHIHIESLISI